MWGSSLFVSGTNNGCRTAQHPERTCGDVRLVGRAGPLRHVPSRKRCTGRSRRASRSVVGPTRVAECQSCPTSSTSSSRTPACTSAPTSIPRGPRRWPGVRSHRRPAAAWRGRGGGDGLRVPATGRWPGARGARSAGSTPSGLVPLTAHSHAPVATILREELGTSRRPRATRRSRWPSSSRCPSQATCGTCGPTVPGEELQVRDAGDRTWPAAERRRGQAASSSSAGRMRPGSTLIPGPIVDETVMRLM